MTPLVLALLLGIIDYGSVLRVRQTMILAAREGARVLAKTNGTPEQAVQEASLILAPLDLPFETPVAEQELGTDRTVSVTIKIPRKEASLVGDPLGLLTGELSVKVTMRKEIELTL